MLLSDHVSSSVNMGAQTKRTERTREVVGEEESPHSCVQEKPLVRRPLIVDSDPSDHDNKLGLVPATLRVLVFGPRSSGKSTFVSAITREAPQRHKSLISCDVRGCGRYSFNIEDTRLRDFNTDNILRYDGLIIITLKIDYEENLDIQLNRISDDLESLCEVSANPILLVFTHLRDDQNELRKWRTSNPSQASPVVTGLETLKTHLTNLKKKEDLYFIHVDLKEDFYRRLLLPVLFCISVQKICFKHIDKIPNGTNLIGFGIGSIWDMAWPHISTVYATLNSFELHTDARRCLLSRYLQIFWKGFGGRQFKPLQF